MFIPPFNANIIASVNKRECSRHSKTRATSSDREITSSSDSHFANTLDIAVRLHHLFKKYNIKVNDNDYT